MELLFRRLVIDSPIGVSRSGGYAPLKPPKPRLSQTESPYANPLQLGKSPVYDNLHFGNKNDPEYERLSMVRSANPRRDTAGYDVPIAQRGAQSPTSQESGDIQYAGLDFTPQQ